MFGTGALLLPDAQDESHLERTAEQLQATVARQASVLKELAEAVERRHQRLVGAFRRAELRGHRCVGVGG